MCAAYLMALRTSLMTALSPASTTSALQRTLNVTAGTVTTQDMQRVVEAYVVPLLRRDAAGGASTRGHAGVVSYMVHQDAAPQQDTHIKVPALDACLHMFERLDSLSAYPRMDAMDAGRCTQQTLPASDPDLAP